MNVKSEICNAFNTQADQYEKMAKVQHEIGERLFARLDYMKITPKYVLDLGCGTGAFTKQLKLRYPSAHIVGLDMAFGMLQCAKQKQSWRKKWPLINADMMAMPFPNGVFDLVFSNQAIHWATDWSKAFNEINRIMNVDGCFMFSTLGPDTFLELKKAWAQVNAYPHTNEFTDMHDLGDILLAERFIDPVVDMEKLTVHYHSIHELLHSLKAQGVRNVNPNRYKGLTTPSALKAFKVAYQAFLTPQNKVPLTYEAVYGQAWKGAVRKTSSHGTETFISINKLKGLSKQK